MNPPKLIFLRTAGGQSLLNVIFGGVSGWRMSVHMVLMSSEDGTLRWKLSRIWTNRGEMLGFSNRNNHGPNRPPLRKCRRSDSVLAKVIQLAH